MFPFPPELSPAERRALRRRWQRQWVQRWLRRARLSTLFTLATLLGGCFNGAPTAPPPSPLPADPADGAVSPWETIAPGLERRLLTPPSAALSTFVALRIDPGFYALRVHYQPGAPQFITGWADALPTAAVIINANYFTPEYTALGLVVSDGAVFGSAYIGMGGLVQVTGETVRVRSTIREPYMGEYLDQAVQGFPLLVDNGATAYTSTRPDRASRRTVAAQDSAGRLVLLASTGLVGLTLTDLAAWLPTTDLGLVTAVNLDGGGSTLLAVRAAQPTTIPSFDPVPTVLAIYPRF